MNFSGGFLLHQKLPEKIFKSVSRGINRESNLFMFALKDRTLKTCSLFIFCICTFCFLHTLSSPALAGLNARAAILMNMSNGRILYKKNPYMPIPPASLTKVMSMFVTFDMVKAKKVTLNKMTKISPSAAKVGGSKMKLRKGENISIEKLLLGMAVSSGNNASSALAQSLAQTDKSFVSLINQKAKNLGMRNSTFKTPHGLPAQGQYTTAYDMLKMARSYMKAHPSAMTFHATRSFEHNKRVHKNTNQLLGQVRGMTGLKTGYTRASGFNLIFSAERNGVKLLGVILGGSSRAGRDLEVMKLLEAGFATPNSSAKVARALNQKKINRKRW